MRKTIEIPDGKAETLRKMAKGDIRTFKNFLENEIIKLATAYEQKEKEATGTSENQK